MHDHADTPPAGQPTWHEGERFLQQRLGMAERMAEVGPRIIRDFMPDQHRDFYEQLPFIVMGSVDGAGDAWATIVEGQSGFIASPTPTALDIAAGLDADDPARSGLRDGASVGLLGIELHTRRRNRMNGVATITPAGLHVDVDQSFGNCPRYIQLRDFTYRRAPGTPGAGVVEESAALDEEARGLIAAADTFFVASYADRGDHRQVDVSHRGGKAGFVRVNADGSLTIPDFDGNMFFSTLGNMLLNGRAGLLFADYASGDVLQMTGDVAIMLDAPETAAFHGAAILWTFHPRRVVRRRDALALRWAMRDNGWSPHSLTTGDWPGAA